MRQMPEKVLGRSSRLFRQRRLAATLSFVALAALGAAAPAMGSLKQDIQRFSDCPYTTPGVVKCVYSTTTGGEFVIGKSAVPISRTVTIQGGLKNGGVLVAATDGNTLSKTALPVPGGLVGIELPGNFTEVTATAELAGQAEISTSVALPLKVKLDNLALGGNCYIGSEGEPISLHLIYGTTNPPPPNKPISGSVTITTKDEEVTVLAGTLVDNSFPAPAASGCTLLPLVGDLAVNAKEGLPAAAGTNTAIMSGATEEVSSQLVAAVLPLPDFGRCIKAATTLEGRKTISHGAFGNAACTAQAPEQNGKYEWAPGPGSAKRFSGAVKPLKLETVAKKLVECTGGSDEGQYTGFKTETTTLRLTGCQSAGAACTTSGAAAEEIQTAALSGSLEFIKENEGTVKPVVGLDLAPMAGSQVAQFTCGTSAETVSGSVIAPVSPVSKMASAFNLKLKAAGGRQSPEAFEVGPTDTLSLGGEQAGVTASLTQTNEEPLEIKAAA